MLNHRGYIFAQQSGTYTFQLASVDETVYIWVGDDAYTGWTAANADAHVSYRYTGGGPGSGQFTVDLVQGRYYPVRVVFANAQGVARFGLSVTAPDGNVFLSANTQGSPYLVQYSCDLVSGRPYVEPFGAET